MVPLTLSTWQRERVSLPAAFREHHHDCVPDTEVPVIVSSVLTTSCRLQPPRRVREGLGCSILSLGGCCQHCKIFACAKEGKVTDKGLGARLGVTAEVQHHSLSPEQLCLVSIIAVPSNAGPGAAATFKWEAPRRHLSKAACVRHNI